MIGTEKGHSEEFIYYTAREELGEGGRPGEVLGFGMEKTDRVVRKNKIQRTGATTMGKRSE